MRKLLSFTHTLSPVELAGGMGIFWFGSLAITVWLGGTGPVALVNASIAAAAGAFSFFKFYQARIFLGGAGSTTFGFPAQDAGLTGWRDGRWWLLFPALIFLAFIVDATVTLLRRAVQRERFWQAHRAHYYQRLVLSGWGHQKTALTASGLMVFCGILSWMCHMAGDSARPTVLVLWVLLIGAVLPEVHLVERMTMRFKSKA
jgi:UDP-N-acetylmuramyl pentapeptide phosphotransferase/UDP-N-acetylglucosamine-1-phosphate transferase